MSSQCFSAACRPNDCSRRSQKVLGTRPSNSDRSHKMNRRNTTLAAVAAGICLLHVWNATAQNQLPTPLISLGFNENSGSSVANAGSVSTTFSKTDPPSWSTNVPISGGAKSVDFGTIAGNYYVESSAVIGQLANLDSFTVIGWINNRNATIGSGGNRIVSWIYNGGNGVDIVRACVPTGVHVAAAGCRHFGWT